MITKTAFLASVSFAIAIGGAYASLFPPETVYVKAKLTSSATAPTVCINTGVTCDNSGAVVCYVIVPVQTGSGVSSTTGSVKTNKISCAVVITHTSSDPQISTISPVYRLVAD